MLARAKARLDRLDLYPRPVDMRHVRIVRWPWLFGIPGFRRFSGYELGPLIVIRRELAHTSDELVVHELCHVWQSQHRHLRMWLSYLTHGYRDNPHEVEARAAAASTREAGVAGDAHGPRRVTRADSSPVPGDDAHGPGA